MLGILAPGFSSAWADDEPATVFDEESIPDLRDDDSDLTVQSGNLVVVPIPMSGPTLETGLILGEMYFYGQTEEQAKKQLASVTGGAGMYTSSDSKAAALVHQGYWKEDTLALDYLPCLEPWPGSRPISGGFMASMAMLSRPTGGLKCRTHYLGT